MSSRRPRRVLVTGGAGFIGSHLVDRLLADGHLVTVVDNFDPFYSPTVKRANLARHLANPAFSLLELDVRRADDLGRALSTEIDTIVHLAALAGVRPSIADPARYRSVNVEGTRQLLGLARERGIGQFVFGSSSSVYGVNPNLPWDESDVDLRPISPYAATKIDAESLGREESLRGGLRFVALRFFTVYGPRQRPDLAIHKFSRLMLDGVPIPVYGDGSTRRDYTYVDDVVRGIRAALDFRDSAFEVINIGNHRTVSLLEMIEVLEQVLGVEAKIQRLPEQQGDVPNTWASVEKAERLLGFRPDTPFEKGIRQWAGWLGSRTAGLLT